MLLMPGFIYGVIVATTVKRRTNFNFKRKFAEPVIARELAEIAERIHYVGNPEHKRGAGDFGLPPLLWRPPDKTLCDGAGIKERTLAESLLRAGLRRGLVSQQRRNGFPQNIWAVTDEGIPLEAQLDNEEQGSYHGYPMPSTDPFRVAVLARARQ
jgi:hypothetical protein